MTENDLFQLHAHVQGRVQGVGFRHFVLVSAQGLGLTGWVRNTKDGSVEVMAEGEYPPLNQLLNMLRKGPISADVADIDYEISEAQGNFTRFGVKATA